MLTQKNIEIDYYFVRKRVISKNLQIKFLNSKDQLADIMTKLLSTPRFAMLLDKLIVAPAPSTCVGGGGDVNAQMEISKDVPPQNIHSSI
jgi:hypothetical protein